MDAPNAFLGKQEQPTDSELVEVLGPAAPLWTQIIEDIANDAGKVTQEWKGIFVNKYGWSFRLKQKKRNIIHMVPCNGCFRVAFILGDKALKAAKEAHWPKKVADALANAAHYPEGNGVRLDVQKASDLPAIRKLAQIKLAH